MVSGVVVTTWPVESTDVKRCQWIDSGRRCNAAPTRYIQWPREDALRGQVICDEHLAALEDERWPQRWSAPETGYVLAGGLRFLVKLKREPAA